MDRKQIQIIKMYDKALKEESDRYFKELSHLKDKTGFWFRMFFYHKELYMLEKIHERYCAALLHLAQLLMTETYV